MSSITYRALLIGNGVFPDDPHNLPALTGPANDLRMLADALAHPQVGLHATEDVRSLYNATMGEVLEAANDFFANATRDDQLFLYYSGHGRLDNYGNLYLTTRDTRTSRLPATAVAAQQLNAMIMHTRSKRVVIVLDCCHSGAFKGGIDVPQALCGDGRFVITSSRAQQLSEDAGHTDGLSAFTRFLVEALLSGGVDRNHDEFVSLNEVYDYVLPRLMDATRQHPQRRFDEVVGDVALGRCMDAVSRRTATGGAGPAGEPPTPAVASSRQEARPILAVSTEQITLHDVDPSETLPEEIIDVFNQGGGTLEWTVSCNDDWIEVEQHKGFFAVRLAPRPGMNRGRIYVRERDGATRRITVEVRVNESPPPPQLVTSPSAVDFGTVSRQATAPAQMIHLINAGAGQLNARATALADWLEVRRVGDMLEVRAARTPPGEARGEILIESDGGDVRVPVTARFEAGPVLEVETRRVAFGRVTGDDDDTRTIRIRNGGDGRLKWDFEVHGDFFTVERTSSGLAIELDGSEGRHRGSIFISSNGGEATIDVEAEVVWDAAEPAQRAAAGLDISGTWTVAGVGSFVFAGSPPTYQYTEFNMLGVACGQGTALVDGSSVQFHGFNIIAGPVQGWLQADARMMIGTVAGQGGSMAITLMRYAQHNPVDAPRITYMG